MTITSWKQRVTKTELFTNLTKTTRHTFLNNIISIDNQTIKFYAMQVQIGYSRGGQTAAPEIILCGPPALAKTSLIVLIKHVTLLLERVPFIPVRLMQAVMVFVGSELSEEQKKRSKANKMMKRSNKMMKTVTKNKIYPT